MDVISQLQRALRAADGHTALSAESQALVTELREALRRDEAAETLIDDLLDVTPDLDPPTWERSAA